MKIRELIGLLFLALATVACQKPVEYPVEPKIAYEGFTYLFNTDSTFSGEGIISFSYTDGDGDLGLDERDTLPPFGFQDAHYYTAAELERANANLRHGDFQRPIQTPARLGGAEGHQRQDGLHADGAESVLAQRHGEV